jgi:SSS family solute:Na+ symporter
MVIAAAWAPQIQHFQGLWAYLQQMFSIMVPPIAVIFLVGVFYKRGNGEGAFWTLVLGTTSGILTFALSELGYWPLHYTITVGFNVGISAIIFIVVSLMTKPPVQSQLDQLTFDRSLINEGLEGMPWYANYKYQMVVLALVIFGLLIWLW